MDGLKPSQRKVLFACFKRNLKQEIKVAQLAGYISEHSAYHHGEASLTQTIIGKYGSFSSVALDPLAPHCIEEFAFVFENKRNRSLLTYVPRHGTELRGQQQHQPPEPLWTVRYVSLIQIATIVSFVVPISVLSMVVSVS
jgi:hypothetical protein